MFTRVGLTGGIGAGKSTVAQHVTDLGYLVIDYDVLARQAVEPGCAGLARVVDYFGPQTLLTDGSMNRAWISSQVFADPVKRAALDGIVHPIVFEQATLREGEYLASLPMSSALSESKAEPRTLVFHDIPLLVESHAESFFDRVVTVEAPPRVRMHRLVDSRHMSLEEAATRIDAQASEDRRRAAADFVIDSNQPIERMFDQVDRVVAILRSE